jgi:hypothetical protein
MATLTPITVDGDGTLDTTNLEHDTGSGTPWWSHFSDDPDGLSSDYITCKGNLVDGTYVSWHSLENVDADFGSMDTLTVQVDGDSSGFGNDECDITVRIADGNESTTWLTDESAILLDELDTTRIQPTDSFTGLTGSKAQWDTAHIRISWVYNKVTGPDALANLRIYGLELTGTYTEAAADTGQPIMGVI